MVEKHCRSINSVLVQGLNSWESLILHHKEFLRIPKDHKESAGIARNHQALLRIVFVSEACARRLKIIKKRRMLTKTSRGRASARRAVLSDAPSRDDGMAVPSLPFHLASLPVVVVELE